MFKESKILEALISLINSLPSLDYKFNGFPLSVGEAVEQIKRLLQSKRKS